MTEDASICGGIRIQVSVVPIGTQTAILGGISMGEAQRNSETGNGVYGRIWNIMGNIERNADKVRSRIIKILITRKHFPIQGIAFSVILRGAGGGALTLIAGRPGALMHAAGLLTFFRGEVVLAAPIRFAARTFAVATGWRAAIEVSAMRVFAGLREGLKDMVAGKLASTRCGRHYVLRMVLTRSTATIFARGVNTRFTRIRSRRNWTTSLMPFSIRSSISFNGSFLGAVRVVKASEVQRLVGIHLV